MPGGRAGAAAAAGVPCIKQEPGYESEGAVGYGTTPAGAIGGEQQQRMRPALAGVCWLRQPTAGRSWSTSSLAMKRLDATGAEGGGGGPQGQALGGAGGGGGGPQETFDSLFSDEAALAGVSKAGAAVGLAKPDPRKGERER
jgi:hypothetical protein